MSKFEPGIPSSFGEIIFKENRNFIKNVWLIRVFANKQFREKIAQINQLFQLWSLICVYYSFKIFSQFWLANGTRIIHHNQLLMTKFGRILYLT